MQPEIAKIKRRLDVHTLAREKQQPTKRSESEYRKNKSNQAEPDTSVLQQLIVGVRDSYRGLNWKRRREEENRERSCCAGDEGNKRNTRIETGRTHAEKKGGKCGARDIDEAGC